MSVAGCLLNEKDIIHINYGNHIINLCVQDFFIIEAKLIKKAKDNVSFMKKTTLFKRNVEEILENNPNLKYSELINSVPTRWNSHYHMI
jgi:hypothetical protein